MNKMHSVPFDFNAIATTPNWREDVIWPLSFRNSFDIGRNIISAYLSFISEDLEGSNRDIALLAGGVALSSAIALTEMASSIEAGRKANIQLFGDNRELDVLSGKRALDQAGDAVGNANYRPFGQVKHAFLRRMVRAKSWSSWGSFGKQIVAPDYTAISHNSSLRGYIKEQGLAVNFVHAEKILKEIRTYRKDDAPNSPKLVEDFIAMMQNVMPIEDEDIRARVSTLIARECAFHFRESELDLLAAKKCPKLPLKLMAGTGGYWPTRLISLEVLRRGGEVLRFEHGAQAGMLKVVEPLAFAELSVSSRFFVSTDKMAARLQETGATDLVRKYRQVSIDHMGGDYNLKSLDTSRTASKNAERRVLYGPSIMRGMRQFVPAIITDVIHLDWNFRLTEKLTKMPIELLLRPHPEGLLRGKTHPLNDLVPVQNDRFESVLKRSDVVIFDYQQSTTFFETLVTDRRVVIIDFGNPLFTPDIWDMIKRRCHVIKADFDDRNRPVVDNDELYEAVMGGDDYGDPTEFRDMLMSNVENA